MTLRISIMLFLVIISLTSLGQVAPNKDRQVVLGHGKVGKMFVFDRSKANDHDKTEITYLGKVRSRDGRCFKILISRWYWGISPRATSRIVVYNDRNQYLGNYYVTITFDLPGRIENNALVFTNEDNVDCDPKLITRISFNYGLPKQFFLKCKGPYGDIYSFGDE